MFTLVSIVSAHGADETNNMMGDNMINMMGNMWDMGSGWGWTAMIFGGLFWLLVIVALILLIAWLIKQIQK